MFVPFKNLPDHARIWVYQADRRIDPKEKLTIENNLSEFTSDWMAHGQPLQASFTILENYFVILAVNENVNDASGCSIDQSTQVMRQISEITGINFFNRTLVPFEISDEVKQINLSDLKQKYQEGLWNEHSIIFNTLAGSIEELRRNWRMKASMSWVKRFIKPGTFDSVKG